MDCLLFKAACKPDVWDIARSLSFINGCFPANELTKPKTFVCANPLSLITACLEFNNDCKFVTLLTANPLSAITFCFPFNATTNPLTLSCANPPVVINACFPFNAVFNPDTFAKSKSPLLRIACFVAIALEFVVIFAALLFIEFVIFPSTFVVTRAMLISKIPIFVITDEPIPLGSPNASLNSFNVSNAAGAPFRRVSILPFSVLIAAVFVAIFVVFVATLFDTSLIFVIFVLILLKLLTERGPIILSTLAILTSKIFTLASVTLFQLFNMVKVEVWLFNKLLFDDN